MWQNHSRFCNELQFILFSFPFLSRHKGVVTEVVEGTSKLHVTLDEGRVDICDLKKQGVRFVPHKQKRSKTWTSLIHPWGINLDGDFSFIDFEDCFIFEASLTEFIFIAAHSHAEFWVKHPRLWQFQFSLKELTVSTQVLFWAKGSWPWIWFFPPICIWFHKVDLCQWCIGHRYCRVEKGARC